MNSKEKYYSDRINPHCSQVTTQQLQTRPSAVPGKGLRCVAPGKLTEQHNAALLHFQECGESTVEF